MRRLIGVSLCVALYAANLMGGTRKVTADLQSAIDGADDGDTLFVAEGSYQAKPFPFVEELCGNCGEHRTTVVATRGFLVEGKSLTILGEHVERTIVRTNAGYGFLFFNSPRSYIANLTITGGVRDTSGSATDAGIVAKFSRVTVAGVHIVANNNRVDSVVVGIGGIFGREGSELIIQDCIIRNNGWDGIALYRGATALITDNIIEQGRGAGIGITWDATATVFRNHVSEYWKGIGTFGTSRAVVCNNAVFDNLGWGLVATGSSFMEASNNVINHNGNCGIAPWDSAASGAFFNNIISNNGWRKEWVCPQVGYWMNGDQRRFEFSYNNVWNNEGGNYKDVEDFTSKNGNVSVDPGFAAGSGFQLLESSAMRYAGHPGRTNLDGSRSHMGLTGGQHARR